MASHRRRPWPNWSIGVLEDGVASTREAMRQLDEALLHLETGRDRLGGICLARAYREIARLEASLKAARRSNGSEMKGGAGCGNL